MNIQIPQQPITIDSTTMFKLRNACKDNLRVGTMIELLYRGVRPNQLINIKVKDFCDDKLQITIRRMGGIARDVFLCPVFVARITKYLALRKCSSPYLFPGRCNEHISIRTLNHLLHKLQISAGVLQNITPRIFRYTFISNRWVDCGVPPI